MDERDGIEELNGMTQEEILMTEDQLLAGMLEAANFREDRDNYKKLQIKRNGKLLFEFTIRPISEEELQACRKTATKYIANPNGRHLPKIEAETDYVKLRSLKIYTATIEEDKKKLWNNPKLKQSLVQAGHNGILTNTDVIEAVFLVGEKDSVADIVDELSGYGVNKEEYVKNLSRQEEDSI